jgi:GTP-binding protein EngB required for normal cell division
MANNQPDYSFADFLKDEETKKQEALGTLLKVNDKISEAIFLLSGAIQSKILDEENLDISLGKLLLEQAKASLHDKIAELWKEKTSEQKEKIENSILGHP